MLNVLLTIDTELWPGAPDWPDSPLSPVHTDFGHEIAIYIDGATAHGDYGTAFQIDTLKRFGLKACFFVESLCAGRIGEAAFGNTVSRIRHGGQEVQLHLHTEWLGELRDPALPPQARQFMHQFTRAEQMALIRKGVANLTRAGAAPVCAFRAGGFGANHDTLHALAGCGIAFDSSYNPSCAHPDWASGPPLEQPHEIGGVVEIPVSTFRDFPGHRRHAQLCACSFAEMRGALLAALSAGWYSFVIVLHSFELVKSRQRALGARADRLNIARFEQLCAFLAANADKFQTRWFADLDPAAVALSRSAPALRSPLAHTLRRVAEQGWSRRNS
jgi:hypothetical protein